MARSLSCEGAAAGFKDTFKVKRNRIKDIYAKNYEAWEASGKTILWQT